MADQRRALIAVLGGPGAGKTSQCARLAQELGYTHLSAGQALKSEAASGGAHAEVIASCQKAGTLVPSETVSSVLRQRLAESSGPVLLDGFPRVFGQIESAAELGEVLGVLFLDAPEDVLVGRLSREDCPDEIALLAQFTDHCLPVLDQYDGEGLVTRIDASASLDDVQAAMAAAVKQLMTASEFCRTCGSLSESSVCCSAAPAPASGTVDRTIISVLGGPGSGKSSQCARVAASLGYTHVEVAKLLKQEVAEGGAAAAEIDAAMKAGQLVPTKTVSEVLEKRMPRSAVPMLLDGFPRVSDQVDAVATLGAVKTVLFLDCTEDVMVERLSKQDCPDEVALLAQFADHCLPVIDRYDKAGLARRIDASVGMDEVQAAVQSVIAELGLPAVEVPAPKEEPPAAEPEAAPAPAPEAEAEPEAASEASSDPRIEKWGKSVFEQFDTDKNGKLTPQELNAALKSLPRKKPKTIPPGAKFMSLDEMIAAMDEDGDGSIDLAEWLSRLGSCAGLAAALDENVNADGEIANFKAPLPPGLQAEKAEASEPEPEAEDPAASLGLVGSAEEDAAAAKMQAVQRGRSARRGVEEKQAEQLAAPELKRARKKFDQMDKDGNGTLDAAEMRELALWVFSSFHPDGEALPADRQQKEAEKLTERLDADGDGKLSFDEFAAWFKKTCAGIAKYRKGLAKRKRAEAAARKEEGGHPAFGSLAEAEQAALQMADDVATKLQSTAVDIEAKSDNAAQPAAATPVLEPAEAASPYAAPKASDEEMRKIAEKHAAELQEEFDAMAHLLSEEEKTELQKELLTLRSSMNADEVEQVLLSMDTDGDGIVDSEELRAGVVKLRMEQQSRGL